MMILNADEFAYFYAAVKSFSKVFPFLIRGQRAWLSLADRMNFELGRYSAHKEAINNNHKNKDLETKTRKPRTVRPATKAKQLAKKWKMLKSKEEKAKAEAKAVEQEMVELMKANEALLDGHKMNVFADGVKAGYGVSTVVVCDADKFDADTLFALYPSAFEQKMKPGIVRVCVQQKVQREYWQNMV